MSKPLIIFSGGGTLGSVVPLLSLVPSLADNFRLKWLGTKDGPERPLVEEAGLEFQAIAAGKLRRYWSWQNVRDLAQIYQGFRQSWQEFKRDKPALVVTAGSFVSVPTIWAAKLQGIKVLVHQLDCRPGLANKLMAPAAKAIAVTWQKSLTDYGAKARWTGSAMSGAVKADKHSAVSFWGLKPSHPIVLVVGGGTGAEALNRLTLELKAQQPAYQIIHVAGQGKTKAENTENYKAFALLKRREMGLAYTAADLVISRAGMGAILELAYWHKPAIIVPMPNSHQEDNAQLLVKAGAATVLSQATLTAEQLDTAIKKLLSDQAEQLKLVTALKAAVKVDSGELLKLVRDLANS